MDISAASSSLFLVLLREASPHQPVTHPIGLPVLSSTVMSTKQRMSILRLSTSSGRSMYFCTIHPAFLRLFQSRNFRAFVHLGWKPHRRQKNLTGLRASLLSGITHFSRQIW